MVRGKREASVSIEGHSESRIRNAKPIERSDTITSMTAAEPSFSALYREAHGQVAEIRALLGNLTITLDRLANAAHSRG